MRHVNSKSICELCDMQDGLLEHSKIVASSLPFFYPVNGNHPC